MLKFYFSHISMCWYSLVIFITVYLALVDSSCSPIPKFYVSCGSPQSLATAIQICNQYGMTLLNLTNSSTLVTDVATLNATIVAVNCTSNFWFASGNSTGYVASLSTLGNVLGDILGGVGLLLGTVLDFLTCVLFICPVTTTQAPITSAMVVCTRPLQQRVIQKCQLTSLQANMRFFQFQESQMYGGILNSFTSNSQTTCSAQCSSNTQCMGISYINGICYLYL